MTKRKRWFNFHWQLSAKAVSLLENRSFYVYQLVQGFQTGVRGPTEDQKEMLWTGVFEKEKISENCVKLKINNNLQSPAYIYSGYDLRISSQNLLICPFI